MAEARSNEFGAVGLGRMGGDLALQALEKGMHVVGFTRGGAPDEMLGLWRPRLRRGRGCRPRTPVGTLRGLLTRVR